jgi:crotonobetainyl-CoA:carnitine CoA-transferase CaiB-like acyl-CoA transferase
MSRFPLNGRRLDLHRVHPVVNVVVDCCPGADLCERDPQLKSRGFYAPLAAASGASTKVTGIPFRISSGSGAIRTIAPEVGENNVHVLSDILGLSAAEQAELVEQGAIWP